MPHSLKTILDNREGQTVLEALKKILPSSKSMDVATGNFEIGSLLALDGFWNNINPIRILMGDETTKRTKKELTETLKKDSDESIEREKEKDDSLKGLEAIRQALLNNIIQAKVYTRAKFHAKAMLMKMNPPHLSHYGIVGSSNFTEPGLCRNIELNILTADKLQLDALNSWYDTCWQEAETIQDAILKVIEPHLKLYTPFEVYAKALYEYFLGKEISTSAWELNESKIYPMLDDLQKDGYRQAMWIAEQWGGSMICDGVGFGKTYIGLMLIERFLYERKRICLIVPKSSRESVWEKRLRQYLGYQKDEAYGAQIAILNHTDLHREVMKDRIRSVQQKADVILIDEAHHFRTPNAQRSKELFDLIEYKDQKKKLFMLTATPVNNSLFDILHLMEYFTRKKRDYFQRLGISDTRNYFVKKEKAIEIKHGLKSEDDEQETLFPEFPVEEAERILRDDVLFNTLVIQRSREYARQYFSSHNDRKFYFPDRDKPVVQAYKLAKVYGDLFNQIKESFSKDNPFLELTLYNTESKKRDDSQIDPIIKNRQKQVISLIRATMLKRMESSYKAFESSCEDLLRSNARFLRHYSPDKWEEWKLRHGQFWQTVETHWKDRYQEEDDIDDVEEDDILPPPADEIDPELFKLDEIIGSIHKDMDELADFLSFIHEHLREETDDKLRALIELLNQDSDLKNQKVIIFTQYRDTARYLYKNLKKNIQGVVEELDSTSKKDRDDVIKRFSPYYNCQEDELKEYLKKPIRVLISTDVLSEGLNLQDSNLLINYDLHWNPVRLMQRLGRVDRRLDPSIEKKINRNNCKVRFWNFLPPDELDSLLLLYQRVSGKLLRISKTMGIEGKQLLTPDDDYEALRNFNVSYNGVMSFDEQMRLIFEDVKKNNPVLNNQLPFMPRRLFSGKQTSIDSRGLFACFRFPSAKMKDKPDSEMKIPGECRWYFLPFDSDDIVEDTQQIHAIIQSTANTPRVVIRPMDELKTKLQIIEHNKVKTKLRDMQALAGEKATLVCWMEIN